MMEEEGGVGGEVWGLRELWCGVVWCVRVGKGGSVGKGFVGVDVY